MQNAQVRAKREVRVLDLFLYFYLNIIIFLVSIGIIVTLILLVKQEPYMIVIEVLIPLIAVLLTIKRFAIGCVLMYKAYAPMRIREKCRFEPSCSTYMILAIEKYGLIKGFIKGIKRIKRCKPPNGGVDYP